MSDDEHQVEVPPSFIALFVPPGRIKPTASREHIRERYEFCEDLANMLTETASTRLWEMGIAERDVLERVGDGLREGPIGLSPEESTWVLRRLAELLGWEDPFSGT